MKAHTANNVAAPIQLRRMHGVQQPGTHLKFAGVLFFFRVSVSVSVSVSDSVSVSVSISISVSVTAMVSVSVSVSAPMQWTRTAFADLDHIGGDGVLRC